MPARFASSYANSLPFSVLGTPVSRELDPALDVHAQRHEDLARAILTSTTVGAKRLIVVLSPGNDLRLGGILSIGKIYQATAALRHIHRARVVMCTVPGEPY